MTRLIPNEPIGLHPPPFLFAFPLSPTDTHSDWQNYFYPDTPKNYQITQYDRPIAEHGMIALPSGKKVIYMDGLWNIECGIWRRFFVMQITFFIRSWNSKKK